jgi:hypothetical protein
MITKSLIRFFSGKSKVLVVATLLLVSMFILTASFIAVGSGSEKEQLSQKTRDQVRNLSETWGIELVAMRSTAAGHMIDFRYRVLDAKKAAPLFVRRTKPYLIHQESEKVLAVPKTAKLGSLRNSNMPKEGRTYWMFFGNQHGLVQKGDKVTVAIGDFRATDIEVE